MKHLQIVMESLGKGDSSGQQVILGVVPPPQFVVHLVVCAITTPATTSKPNSNKPKIKRFMMGSPILMGN